MTAAVEMTPAAIAELSKWCCFTEACFEAEARAAPKVGRNDPCRCGNGKTYKKYCLQ